MCESVLCAMIKKLTKFLQRGGTLFLLLLCFWFSIQNPFPAKDTGKMLRMEHIFEPEDARIKDLVKFDRPEALELFTVRTDAEIGGKSVAKFFYDDGKAVFEGVLDLTPAAGVTNSGFAAIVSKESRGGWELEDFNALLVRAKTDGRVYVTNLKAPSVIEDDLWQLHTVGEKDQWTSIVLPFSKFVATHRGFVEGQLQLDTRLVESIGILMAQRKDGPFRIELKSISAINMDLYHDLPGRRWTGVSSDKREID